MQTENRIFDDLARVANGIAGTVAGMTREASETFRQRSRDWAGGAAEDMVSREEFDAVKAMAAAARDEVELLKARLAALEAGSTDQVIVEEDTDAIEAGAPIDTLERYAAARGLEPKRVSEDEFVATARGSWGSYELRGVWRDEDGVLQFLAFPDIRVAEGSRVAIYEAIGLINETLWLGHFELWGSTGVVVYRHAAMIDGEEEPTLTVQGAELIVEAAIDEIDRFYPVFQFVLWGGKSPREALAAAMIETHGEA